MEGNRGHRPIPNDVPSYPAFDVVSPPDDLSEGARREWLRVAPLLSEYGLLTAADLALFRQYCQTVDDLTQARAEVDRDGAFYRDGAGIIRQNPASRAVLALSRELRALGAAFGLSPESRSRVSASVFDAAAADDPMEALLSGSFNQ